MMKKHPKLESRNTCFDAGTDFSSWRNTRFYFRKHRNHRKRLDDEKRDWNGKSHATVSFEFGRGFERTPFI